MEISSWLPPLMLLVPTVLEERPMLCNIPNSKMLIPRFKSYRSKAYSSFVIVVVATKNDTNDNDDDNDDESIIMMLDDDNVYNDDVE